MTEPDGAWWVAATDWMEAQGEPPEGQAAVAWTIRNRAARLGALSDGILARVCLAPRQFSCWNTTSPVRVRLAFAVHDPAWPRVVAIVTTVLAADAADDPTHGATHYLRTDLVPKPDWFDPAAVTAVIGAHTFLRLP